MLKTDKKAKQIPKDVPTQKGAYIRLAKTLCSAKK
jgi:hypothetical protein